MTNTTSYADSFNKTNTQTDVKENLGNTALTLGGGSADYLPLLLGAGIIFAGIMAAR